MEMLNKRLSTAQRRLVYAVRTKERRKGVYRQCYLSRSSFFRYSMKNSDFSLLYLTASRLYKHVIS